MRTVDLHTPEDTDALGARLGAAAVAGDVIALVGDLGAGKTCFTQGFGRAMGIPHGIVSPTFVVVQTHEGGRLVLHHADVYRVDSAAELEQTGLEDLLWGRDVCVVEWADKHPDILPDEHLHLRLVHTAGGRRAELTPHGARAEAWLAALDG
jgi:tRNA threonylcarbamoyladenosine biosynthesis protein TsaE